MKGKILYINYSDYYSLLIWNFENLILYISTPPGLGELEEKVKRKKQVTK